VSQLPIVVVASAISKQECKERFESPRRRPSDPTWPLDLYHLAMDFVLERSVEFLEQQRGDGTGVVAEARGKREDRQLREHYERRRMTPTQFYSAERFALLPERLEFRDKNVQVALVELADLMAPRIASRTLGRDES
jgi:hypothetical protein